MNETSKREETRKKILENSLKLFQSKGFETTTMREIAEKSGLAVGAAYYHFNSKDAIVFAFYEATQLQVEKYAEEIVVKERNVKTKIEEILKYSLSQLSPYRSFLSVLGQTAISPHNPLSPFSKETKDLRDRCIRIFELALQGGNMRVSKLLAPLLPKIFWFYQMGIVFFWLHDESAQQKRTTQLIDQTLGLIIKLLNISALPLLKPFSKKVVDIVAIIESPN